MDYSNDSPHGLYLAFQANAPRLKEKIQTAAPHSPNLSNILHLIQIQTFSKPHINKKAGNKYRLF